MDSKAACEIALTHLKNNQFITAHNLFLTHAESLKKSELLQSALFYMLAAKCKSKQGKDSKDEIKLAGELFLKFSKLKNAANAKAALLCASKCFLLLGDFEKAKETFKQAKSLSSETIEVIRPVVIIDDSKAIAQKLKTYAGKLGYKDILIFENGKSALKGCEKLFSENKKPIVLLDMGLPDIDGDVISSKLLKENSEIQIIVITADEKTTERVNKTISSGVAAFIQKPFTLDEVKKAIDIAESEYSLL